MNIKNLDKIKLPEDFDEKIEKTYRRASVKERKIFPKRRLAAALSFVFLMGFAVPGYTRDMPLYSEIFSLLGMEKYQDSSELILTTKEDQGIKITISDAILSNNVLSYTYIIETDRDLGEFVNTDADMSLASAIKYKIRGQGGSSKVEKVSDGVYLGVDELWLDFKDGEVPDEMDFSLCFSSIDYKETYDDKVPYSEIRGKWNFPISVKKLDEKIIKPKFIFKKDGVFAKINSININSAVTSIELNLWNDLGLISYAYDIDPNTLVIKDEEGMEYEVQDGGGNADTNLSKRYYQTQILEEGKEYRLEMDIFKNGRLGYSENGQVEMLEGHDSPAFKNAPDKIMVIIPFEL